ncbi:hypothetical protein R9C00_01865 [Flammeovirgaceae bacterium SG7u.111]|nr:hypothetical protein [Flammeovirgaceae bacterium SG7u.132]WPO36188.1 hypothetical protein R9C00_01865 [Flammeovirgaceae bacterium SG7u.111]
MKKIARYIIIPLSLFLLFTSCEDVSDMAIERTASPVLALFDGSDFSAADKFTVEATFYELDKSGILDQNVGIDSIPLSGMEIKVFINNITEIGTFTTDASGKIIFEDSKDVLEGASTLEWSGTHKDISFRVLQNF